MQICNCVLSKFAENIELTNSTSSYEINTGITMWVYNAVYSNSNKEPPSGWLNNSIISAPQKLMLQLMSGCNHQRFSMPRYIGEILYRFFMFTIATGVSFLILDVRMVLLITMTAWILVSSATMQLIATLVFSPASKLKVGCGTTI